MARSKKDIIVAFVNQFAKDGFHNCYVGITSDSEKQLFQKHNISRKKDVFLFEEAPDSEVAKELEGKFLKWGMQSAAENRDSSSNIIYAYSKTSNRFSNIK